MRAIWLVVVGAAALSGAGCTLHSRQGPYCAFTAEYTNCGYYTLASCRAGLSGSGAGICGLNPAYAGEQRRPSR